MSRTAPGRTEIRFWLTPEASKALTDAADLRGVQRGRYVQNVIRHILSEHRPELDADELLPRATGTNKRFMGKRDHALGYKGRWSKWTRAQCICATPLPYILTKIAQKTGDLTMSSLIRRYLADAIERDVGKRVPMPNSASGVLVEGRPLA